MEVLIAIAALMVVAGIAWKAGLDQVTYVALDRWRPYCTTCRARHTVKTDVADDLCRPPLTAGQKHCSHPDDQLIPIHSDIWVAGELVATLCQKCDAQLEPGFWVAKVARELAELEPKVLPYDDPNPPDWSKTHPTEIDFQANSVTAETILAEKLDPYVDLVPQLAKLNEDLRRKILDQFSAPPALVDNPAGFKTQADFERAGWAMISKRQDGITGLWNVTMQNRRGEYYVVVFAAPEKIYSWERG